MRKNVILVLFVLSVSVGLFGQYGYTLNMFEPEIIDARAEALGRTSILSSSGANYVFNNPAMLSNLDQKNVQFNSRVLFGNLEIKSKVGGDTYKYKYEYLLHTKLNGLSLGMPFSTSDNENLKLGFAVGYRTYYDWGYNVHYESAEVNDNYEFDHKSHGGFSTLVLGGGLNYQKKFFGGVSFSFPFLSNISSEYENTYGDKDNDEGTLKGSFFTLSGSCIFFEKVTVGARFRTGFTLKLELDDDEGDITIPSEIGLAIEIKPNANLKLYAEYLTRSLGDYEIDEGEGGLYGDPENGYSIRTGFEVGTSYVFRGGFFMQSVPIYEIKSYYDEVLEDYYFVYDEKPQTETGFTAGFGMKINPNISLDLFGAYSFLNYDENFNIIEEFDISNDYSYSRIKIGCSMGYNF